MQKTDFDKLDKELKDLNIADLLMLGVFAFNLSIALFLLSAFLPSIF